jgi:hypothetical protein
MKHVFMFLALFGVSLCGLGCGGEDTSDEAREEAAQQMEEETQELSEQLPADL